MSRSIISDKALIGFAGSPWTVATYMIEGGASKNYAKVKGWAYKDEQSFNTLINIITTATIDHLSAQIDNGADAVKLFDSWAGVLSPSQFAKWVVKPTRDIVEAIKWKHPTVKVIGFPKGAGHQYIDYVNKTGVDAVAIDTSIDLSWAAKELNERVVIQGNLDPISLIVGGEPMLYQASSIVTDMKDRPHIFNLGHGVLPETPPENVEALAIYLRNLGEGNLLNGELYLIKALHLISVIAWMAGFYICLDYTYITRKNAEEPILNTTFKTMERRLMLFIMNPAMIASFVFGIWMIALVPELLEDGWMQAKIFLLVAMTGYHGALARWRRFLQK